MIGLAYVFCRISGAGGLGHVGGAFQLPNGNFRCFATENPSGGAWVSWKDKGFWEIDCQPNQVVDVFRQERVIGGVNIAPYDVYKIKQQNNPNYNNAVNTLAWCAQQDYIIFNPLVPVKARTCLDDVCDTLSAYGLWMPWTVTFPAPNAWFNSMVDCQTYNV